MTASNPTRRQFLGGSLGAIAAAAALPGCAAQGPVPAGGLTTVPKPKGVPMKI